MNRRRPKPIHYHQTYFLTSQLMVIQYKVNIYLLYICKVVTLFVCTVDMAVSSVLLTGTLFVTSNYTFPLFSMAVILWEN